MIHCPYCDVSFSPSYKCCPKCNDFPTPQPQRLQYLKRKAEEYATEAIAKADVREYLIANGLSDLEADETVASAFSTLARDNRSYGCVRLLTGTAMLIFGIISLLTLALCLAGSAIRLGGSLMGLVAIVGLGMTIGGVLAILSGLYSATTGRS